MMTAWGDTSEEDEASEEEAAAALMARSETDSDFLNQLKVYPNSRIRYVVLAKLKLRNYHLP